MTDTLSEATKNKKQKNKRQKAKGKRQEQHLSVVVNITQSPKWVNPKSEGIQRNTKNQMIRTKSDKHQKIQKKL
mgnify:CR=1 FL=1